MNLRRWFCCQYSRTETLGMSTRQNQSFMFAGRQLLGLTLKVAYSMSIVYFPLSPLFFFFFKVAKVMYL